MISRPAAPLKSTVASLSFPAIDVEAADCPKASSVSHGTRAEWEHGLNMTVGDPSSGVNTGRECCVLPAAGMKRFVNARVGCQNDLIWHSTIWDVLRKGYVM